MADQKRLTMKPWITAILLAVVAIAPVLIFGYYRSMQPVDKPIASVEFAKPQALKAGSQINVKACKVIDGFRYDMYLDGGNWIEAHLAVATKDEANLFVVELLKTTTYPPPTVTLLKHVGNYWIVDFCLTVDGKRVNMVNVLQEKGLLL